MKLITKEKEQLTESQFPSFLEIFQTAHNLPAATANFLNELESFLGEKQPTENLQNMEAAIFKVRSNPDPIIAIRIGAHWYSLFEWE